jgi:Cys-rich repeat protein
LPQDATCYSASICGYTIWCTNGGVAHCNAVPACNSGDQQVASQSDCLQDAICYSRTACDTTIWCTGTSGGSCNGPNPAGCTADTDCASGQYCSPNPYDNCLSSSCSCDPSTGTWACTADCSGGICVTPA